MIEQNNIIMSDLNKITHNSFFHRGCVIAYAALEVSSISSGVVIVLIIVLSPMTSYMRSSSGLVADIGTGCVSVCMCVGRGDVDAVYK